MAEALEGKLLISILAGVTIRQLTSWVLSSTRVVRAMPNTPCKVCHFHPFSPICKKKKKSRHPPDHSHFFFFHLSFIPQIREGMTVISNLEPSPYHETDNNIILNIFSSIGRCRFLDEKHFDACTALAGSGPAFVCTFLEAMADGGVMMGLPRMEALELAAQSELNNALTKNSFLLELVGDVCCIAFQGAARMVLQGNIHPAQIKDAVSSTSSLFPFPPNDTISSQKHLQYQAPGGSTIAGILALEDGRVRSTIARSIQVATERASQLGQPTTREKSN